MLIEKPEDRAFLMSAMRAIASAARTEGIEFQRYWALEQAAKQMGEHAPPALRDAVASAERACSRGRLRRLGLECFFSEALMGQPTPNGKIPLGAKTELARVVKAREMVAAEGEKELGIGTGTIVPKDVDDPWFRVVAAVACFAERDDLDQNVKVLLERDPLLTAEEAVETVIRSWEGKSSASLYPAIHVAVAVERAEFSARMQEALRKIPS